MSTDAAERQPRRIAELADMLRSGLPDHREAMAEAERNEAFYACRNALYVEPREGETTRDFDRRPKQFSRMTRRAVRVLSSLLYAPGPERTHPDAASDALLQQVYEKASVNALMQRADRKAILNGWCGIQAVAKGDPTDPVRLYLWGPDEAVPIMAEDDPLEVWAVVTKSMVPGRKPGTKRRRFEVWSADEYQVWESKDYNPHLTEFADSWNSGAEPTGPPQPNPYGVLPFTFVFADLPVNRFGGDGIGSPIVEANIEVDRMLSSMAELLDSYNRPLGFMRNVSADFRWKDKIGQFTRLNFASADMVEAGLAPEAFFLQPEVNVESTWAHITELINQTFEDLDVPVRAVRGSTSADAESGVAIVAKHTALTGYTKSKQPQFTLYEQSLASMVLTVAGNWYGYPVVPDAPLAVVWPEPRLPISSSEIDASDAYEQQWGILSRTALVMRRKGLTRTQATQYLRMIAEDIEAERELFGDPETHNPEPTRNAIAQEAEDDPQTEDDEDGGAEGVRQADPQS